MSHGLYLLHCTDDMTVYVKKIISKSNNFCEGILLKKTNKKVILME